jgi:hypothetical protein
MRVLALLLLAACSGPVWDDEPVTFAEDHPRVYITKNKDRLQKAIADRTPAATRFTSMVDRWIGGEDIYAFSAWNSALLGQLTGDAKYCKASIAAIEKQVKDAENAISNGDAPPVAGDSYLEIGEMIGDLTLVYDWCFDSIAEDRRAIWLSYADNAVRNVWSPETATWGGRSMPWTGWAIDDPSNNYYYSFLRATMLLGLVAHGEREGIDAYLDQFRTTKLDGQLFPAFDTELVGGGSREGTGYGLALRNLFELYDIWQASTNENLAGKTKHTRASMVAFMHATLPTLDRVAPTGDQSRDSTAAFFDYHRAYLEELISLFPTDPMAPHAKALLQQSSVPQMGQMFMYAYDFLYDAPSVTASNLSDVGTVYHAPGTGQLYMRSSWDKHATWVNLIAGPYTQSHAHQDQGALMLYKDGWLSYDAVVDSHSGLRQEVGAHSTMRIGDLEQRNSDQAKLVALHKGSGYVHAAADLAPVYEGAVQKLQREIVFLEPDTVVIFDRVQTSSSDEQAWQMAMPMDPNISGTRASGAGDGHTLNIERLSPAGATSSVYNFSSDDDFSGGYRLDETIAGGDRRWLHVAWIDSGASSVSGIDDHTAQVTLANGKVAKVSFTRDSIGATLTLDGTTINLGAGVDSMPE